ncbi:Rieske domain-containing protein [Thelonectria olida]|uniref:Rieske domain-containing protein n=1 Tax=Thelonectria olida TaxID=1576542 RepID=A0A9P9ANW5_9HYPO|nr:Rieske domain-containing protein [Thelonectria olida]
MNSFNFKPPARPEAQWFPVGLTSSFPELDDGLGSVAEPRMCNAELKPGCKVFHVPQTDPSQGVEIPVEPDSAPADSDSDEFSEARMDLKDQVLVFQYRGKFHAIDHQCPHSSFPLSRGMPFDIEDFGIVLSAGITCPKHGWSFDVFSGMGDRGSYKLKVWEVQLRDVVDTEEKARPDAEAIVKEVWVRRKQRIG